MSADPKPRSSSGSFAPLAQPVFAVLWVATVLGNIGSFMRDVASAWMVTELSASPAAVSLVQVAATLPIFLLAIPAGVLSDILDRRKFLIGIQVLLACVSGTLLWLSRANALTVEYLVALTFIGGIGAALMGPTWQSIVPELVPRQDLKNAVALNSLGINVARWPAGPRRWWRVSPLQGPCGRLAVSRCPCPGFRRGGTGRCTPCGRPCRSIATAPGPAVQKGRQPPSRQGFGARV
jgi:predicted MFS family arabinose efflux permease